ncbi:unnamed protein product [Bemisia tabaci]|uniref:Uncharacterized protein n=1 Tax=Bemisia tabaci TaxID=7038 RepID=A0A9P0F4C9_BEMTA|nr:unnamed protein product [Bemisia tabaci]
MEEDVKGAPGSKLVSRIVNNQNGMQRKQDVVFDLNGNRQNLGLNPVKMLEHATVQVNPQSTLVAPPGTMVNVYFDVTNNLNIPVLFTFNVQDRHNLIRGIQPIQRRIESLRTEIVTVMVETRMGAPEVDLITFIAHLGSVETVGRKAIFRIGEPVSDTTGPDIDYSYNGDCRDAWTPQTCSTAVWGADITVSDTESGLLRVSSFPLGLQYRGDFVAGTRDNVYLHYSASCCDTKVDVIATDLKGNTYKRTINVERQWWTAAEISALVLGIILLLLLLGLVIAGIITCCRNRGSRDFTR